MAVLDEIVKWARSELPSWQAEAVRRLLLQGTLTPVDKEDLLLMLKGGHGLLKAGEKCIKPKLLCSGDVPGTESTARGAVLCAVEQLTNVNALPAGSGLTFGEQGLTIIYGDNASGKSGYARVLKKACRARDTTERIHPNIYKKTVTNPASAIFVLRMPNGETTPVKWVDGIEPPDILANICVFDSKCARIIIDDENEVVYLPYGAHVFQGLVELLHEFRDRVNAERPQVEPIECQDVAVTTRAGTFLASLTADTSSETLEGATQWSEEDESQLQSVTQDIAKAAVEDPTRQAQRLRNLKGRISAVENEITKIASRVSAEAVGSLERQIRAVKDAERAFAIASQDSSLLSQEPLSGAGGNEWKLLYEAAQKYSTEVAYAQKEFPYVGDGSLCVLCMQHLSDEAKARFRRFKSFMEQAVRRQRDKTTAELLAALKELCDLDLDILNTYKDAFDEIHARDRACADAAKVFLDKALIAKMTMEAAAQARTPISPVEMPACPSSSIQKVIESMENEAQRLDRSAEPAKAASLKSEKEELAARKRLHEVKPQLTVRLQQLRINAKYNQCVRETDTTSVTKKSRQIISGALTQEFETLLNKELSEFGSHIRLRLEMKGVAGETIHKLALKDCQLPARARVTDILSEGEQRIVSIASFLAELKACGRNSPVVFDDPVSSLDHIWREKVARRLATESSNRQVIVFTHDIVFTTSTMFAAQNANIPVAVRCIQRIGDLPGATSDSIPWKAVNVRQSIDALKKQAAHLPNTWKTNTRDHYEQIVRSLYSKLRATWEKTVEEVAFAGSVLRFEAHVRVNKGILKVTAVDLKDWHALISAHKKCCDVTDAHDNIGPRNAPVPDPAEVVQDVSNLEYWVETVLAKQKPFN